jgi:hypothetical protein
VAWADEDAGADRVPLRPLCFGALEWEDRGEPGALPDGAGDVGCGVAECAGVGSGRPGSDGVGSGRLGSDGVGSGRLGRPGSDGVGIGSPPRAWADVAVRAAAGLSPATSTVPEAAPISSGNATATRGARLRLLLPIGTIPSRVGVPLRYQ